MSQSRTPERTADILARLLARPNPAEPPPATPPSGRPPRPVAPDPAGRYDFDLAEFPLFRLNTLAPGRSAHDPLRYTDTITGRDGKPVARSWAVHPGPFGFGGPSAQVLLFDLLQLYAEQGACGTQVQFGTLRSLLLRRGHRNPSARDYTRLRRDFDVLRGYDIHCTNAFWDSARRAYTDMNWRLFGAVFYFRAGPAGADPEQPFGFIEVSPTLQAVAKARGFFRLGFDRPQFYALKPLEQRLAVYLAKSFTSQKLHRRFVRDLAAALPVEAARERDTRRAVAAAADGLLVKRLPILAGFRLTRSTTGAWVAEFTRGTTPTEPYTLPRAAAMSLAPAVAEWVDRIAEAVGSADDRVWWVRCVELLGPGAVDRGLGLLKEARQSGMVRNPGGLLTTFFKSFAAETGVCLR